MRPVCFVDTETTGLHADRHAIWEVALITPDDVERVWQFGIVETDADPVALSMNRYWDRRWPVWQDGPLEEMDTLVDGEMLTPYALPTFLIPAWCRRFQALTAGLHLAGAVVSFDEERLRRLLWAHGVMSRWHYHLIDVEAVAVGYLVNTGGQFDSWRREDGSSRLVPPWDSSELSKALGVDPEKYARHTALGDAHWARAMYDAMLGGVG